MGAVKEPGPGDAKRLDDELDRVKRGDTPTIAGPGQNLVPREQKPGEIRQQVINRAVPKSQPQIIDVRTRPPLTKAGGVLPVRTVVYVEVGGLDQAQVWELCRQYSAGYQGSVNGPHYIIPVREGKLGSEMEFEAQFLETVAEICEIRDGKIVLRDGARAVQVMRTHVDAGGV